MPHRRQPAAPPGGHPPGHAAAPAGCRGPPRAATPAPAPPAVSNDPWAACAQAIAIADRNSGLPPGLLGAIARVETGRRTPTGGVQPWPWSFNAAGEGRYMASRTEAIAEVQTRQAAGTRSIDIGCMQINLLHHPDAFASVEAGFDPETNVRYAVRYLKSLVRAHRGLGGGDGAVPFLDAGPRDDLSAARQCRPDRAGLHARPGAGRDSAAWPGDGGAVRLGPWRRAAGGRADAVAAAGGRGAERGIAAARTSGGGAAARPRIMCLRTSSRARPG